MTITQTKQFEHPTKTRRYETKKSTSAAKAETLRRKTIRREKYRSN